VAKAYLTQWRALRAAASDHPDSLTGDNSKPASFVGTSGVRTTVQFTRAGNRVDLAALGEVVAAAKLGVLFLMFMPGAAGVLADVRAAAKRAELLVRGVVSTLPNGPVDEHTGTTTTLTTTLLGGPPSLPKTQTVDVVQPQGLEHVAAGWAIETTRQQFLSRIGYAIIHSKVLVVDPFSDDPVVVTGSHNFSISASEDNDENYVIIRGDRKLAEAYAVNIESAWRHYAARMGNPHPTLSGSAYLEALLEDQQREKRFWGLPS
jgi:phosphatidylserine/phosphatidylglycerophosphate/cardiolipin synthase-like enzyme